MKIANKAARSMVENLRPFEGSNLFARWEGNDSEQWYVVYSYGEHFPMYINAQGAWFENEDKYSPTTSKHKSQARPSSNTFLLTTEYMKRLARSGYSAIAQDRILRGN
jgi:hypothetical protein